MKRVACLLLVALAVSFATAQPVGPNATEVSPPPGLLPAPLAADTSVVSPAPAPASPSPSPSPGPSPSPSPRPSPGASSSPSPGPSLAVQVSPSPGPEVVSSPAPNATAAAGGAVAVAAGAAASPAAAPTEDPAAAASPAQGAAPTPANITNANVSSHYTSPLYAIQSTPQLKELAKLGAGSEVAKLLADKKLIATIFAPDNEAVTSAIEFVQNATGADADSLAQQGVIEQLLSYHVAEGAAILLSNFKDNQTLTMLDGNKTTIVREEASGPARKLLQKGNGTYFIVSDSNQRFQFTGPANIQGGKSMIHVINGVLVPQALLQKYNITNTTDLPRVNASAATTQAGSTTSRDAPTAVTTSVPQKSSAARATAAALLAAPALLAALVV